MHEAWRKVGAFRRNTEGNTNMSVKDSKLICPFCNGRTEVSEHELRQFMGNPHHPVDCSKCGKEYDLSMVYNKAAHGAAHNPL